MNTIGSASYTATTIATFSDAYRKKFFSSSFQEILKRSLIGNAICDISSSGEKYIANPYSSSVTAAVQALAGTYSVSAWSVTEEVLNVADEFTYGEHIFNFEEALSSYNMMADRQEKIAYALKAAIDIWAVNELCESGTGTLDTPTGGFTTPANLPVIVATIMSKLAGYSNFIQKGVFCVIEAGDTLGLQQFQMATGFSYADAALNNGLIAHLGGVDFYVVLDSTFQDATTSSVSGTKTWTNAGHRVAGVKGVATLSVRDPQWEEKGVTGKTGKEVCGYAYAGMKVWTNIASLIIDITVK
jgi:hypothetical protein